MGSVGSGLLPPGAEAAGGNVTYHYHESCYVVSISPIYGPQSGGTLVDISGVSFINVAPVVYFGATPVPGVVLNSTTVQCLAPESTSEVQTTPISLTFNGVDCTSARCEGQWHRKHTKAAPGFKLGKWNPPPPGQRTAAVRNAAAATKYILLIGWPC